MSGGYIALAVILVILWLLWRRRAGRRQADAQERIASVISPLPPKGRYPRPARGLHRLGPTPERQLARLCIVCSRVVPADAAIAPDRWLLLDVCVACASEVDRQARSSGGPSPASSFTERLLGPRRTAAEAPTQPELPAGGGLL